MFYLDDGTLGGSVPEVLEDLQLVVRLAPALGLQLNRGKTELISDDPARRGEDGGDQTGRRPRRPDREKTEETRRGVDRGDKTGRRPRR